MGLLSFWEYIQGDGIFPVCRAVRKQRPLSRRIPLWAGAAQEGIEEGARPVYRQQQQASRTLR